MARWPIRTGNNRRDSGSAEDRARQWKKDSGNRHDEDPRRYRKAADELQKKVDAIAGNSFVNAKGWKCGAASNGSPTPLPNQVQNLLDDLDGFAAAPSDTKKKAAELTPLSMMLQCRSRKSPRKNCRPE